MCSNLGLRIKGPNLLGCQIFNRGIHIIDLVHKTLIYPGLIPLSATHQSYSPKQYFYLNANVVDTSILILL